MRLPYSLVRLLVVITITFSYSSLAETLKLAFINSGAQKTVISELSRQYEQNNPGVKIELVTYPDAEFKKRLPEWLNQNSATYDLIFWQGGQRLLQYVERNQITPLDELFNSSDFTSGSLGAVEYEGSYYAIPTTYYQWGIYYRKSIFTELNLSPPADWEALMRVGKVLKQNGIAPLALGNSGKWPASAWFDYLDLRLNGLEFHSELLQGRHSFLDERVTKVFQHWKQLVDNGFYTRHQQQTDWNEVLPFIYHRHAAMILIGNFVVGEIPPSQLSDFGFIPFPAINTSIPVYEDAPLDVVMVPRNVEVTAQVKSFVRYISGREFQSAYSSGMGMISPHKEARLSDGAFIAEGADLLGRAEGMAQFFDRDTKAQFVGPALDVFSDFLSSGDAVTAQQQLEKLRKTHLINN